VIQWNPRNKLGWEIVARRNIVIHPHVIERETTVGHARILPHKILMPRLDNIVTVLLETTRVMRNLLTSKLKLTSNTLKPVIT
jgi:hypothetical protein